MKSYIKHNWLSFSLLAATVAFGFWLSPQLPDLVPSHFNIEGKPDAYSNKIFTLAFLPGINLLLLLALPSLTALSPVNYQMANSQKGLSQLNFVVTFLFCGIQCVILQSAFPPAHFPLELNIAFVVSVFMILIGNYLGKIERNFFVGVRTPWTLASDKNWLATHRFTGRIFVILGLISTATSFVTVQLYWAIGFLIFASLLSVLYSFYFYLKFEKPREI